MSGDDVGHSWEEPPEQLHALPGSPLTLEHDAAPFYPSTFERIMRLLVQAAALVALILVSLLMITFIRIGSNIGDAVNQVNAPDPISTGCPFGDEECGG